MLGKEPAALLNVFDGSMIIHAGKRPAPGVRSHFTDQSVIRLYCVRNEEVSEACLLQVPPSCESLRSRSCFLLLLCNQGEIFLWHGCKANEGSRQAAERGAQQLIEKYIYVVNSCSVVISIEQDIYRCWKSGITLREN